MLLQTKNMTLTTCMIMYLIIHAFFMLLCEMKHSDLHTVDLTSRFTSYHCCSSESDR